MAVNMQGEPEEGSRLPAGPPRLGRGTDLAVIAKAKDLSSYILTVTEKSPKRFRFTLTSRLQNSALDIVENLYLANEVFVNGSEESKNRRLELQHKAMTRLKLLCYIAQLSMEQKAILYKQYELITRQAYDCQNMLGAWIKSDRKRFSGR